VAVAVAQTAAMAVVAENFAFRAHRHHGFLPLVQR
jgi:hypothetical protein